MALSGAGASATFSAAGRQALGSVARRFSAMAMASIRRTLAWAYPYRGAQLANRASRGFLADRDGADHVVLRVQREVTRCCALPFGLARIL
jgi:hypothetical protein